MIYQWAAGEKKEDDLPGQLGNWVNVNQGAYQTLSFSLSLASRPVHSTSFG